MEPEAVYTDDLDISMDEEALALLNEQSMEVDGLLETAIQNGGVCRQTVIDMESIQPGVLTTRVPLNRFTEDWSRTNYTVTTEALEDMSQGAKIAIALGVGVLVAKIVHWIIKSFFGEDSDSGGGGGGGGGKKQEKRLKEIRENNKKIHNATQDMIRDFNKQQAEFKLVVSDAFKDAGIQIGQPKSTLDLAIADVLKTHLGPHYSRYINECYKNSALSKARIEHLAKDITSLTDSIINGYRRLESHLNDANLKPDDFKIPYKFVYPGWPALDSAVAATHLLHESKAMCVAEPSLHIPDAAVIADIDIPFISFDEINSTANREKSLALQDVAADMDAKFKAMRAEDVTNQLAALAHLKEAAKSLATLWNITVPFRTNGQKYSDALKASDIALVQMMTKLAKGMHKESKKDEDVNLWLKWLTDFASFDKAMKSDKPIVF